MSGPAISSTPVNSTPVVAGQTLADASPNPAASQAVFLQLLIAQLKHQDPENPADGTEFVTQLAQFTTLEQTTQSRITLDQILSTLQAMPVISAPHPAAPGAASGTQF